MAMGQGEQRGLHAFFGKEFGVPTLHTEPVNDVFLRPAALESNGSHASQSSVAALDHDLNEDRRKRRKTNNDTAEPSDDAAVTKGDTSEHHDGSDPAATEPAIPTDQPLGTLVTVEIPSPSRERDQQQQLQTDNPKATLGDPGEKKQKVIKLNANGKLLSSPVADKFTDKLKAKGNRRGKAALHKVPERKLVVIKYISKGGSSESLGQLIDEILCGKRKHISLNKAAPKPAPTQPPKVTHPFFLKNAAQKPDVPPSHPPQQDSAPTLSENALTDNAHAPHRTPASRSLFSFKHTFVKVPDSMHPLWPPHGFTHVRNLDDETSPYDDGGFLQIDRKKSKTPAIQVNDDESVLTLFKDMGNRSALREPSKQIISGRALQHIMAERLTRQRENPKTDSFLSHHPSHPAIVKLYNSLTTSMTPFDHGEYETQAWAQKYAPSSAQQVLCATKEALLLRDWLKHLIVSSIETGNSVKDTEKAKRNEEKKRKKRKKAEKLDGFIVSSEDEASQMGEISGSDDELAGDVTVSNKRTVIRTGDLTFNLKSNERGRMTNAILLSGPSGCGKTASVYAAAKEMDFEVFEINAGQRRSAKDILDRIGDMTQNHLVHNVHDNEDKDQQTGDIEDAKQNKLMGFFKSSSTAKKPAKPRAKAPPPETTIKQTRSQKQSLILLEEADILFEEDKQFWTGVITLIKQSKRPIVITCNDESLVPLDDISFHAILRFRAPSQELAVDYLLLMAANEGHVLERRTIEQLYLSTRNDLRKSITELNYWCQMAVGSEKSGLDWFVERWPQGVDLDSNGDKLRVLSTNTYDDHMGWFSRDALTSPSLATETELREEALHWWQLSLQEAESMEDSQHSVLRLGPDASKLERLENLRIQSEYMESRSVLDFLAAACSLDAGKDAIDTSIPPILEKQKLNYVEGFQLLHADPVPDYTRMTLDIGSTFQSLLGRAFRQNPIDEDKEMFPANMLKATSKPKATHTQEKELLEALVPIVKPDCELPPPNGGVELWFEHGKQSIAEDLSPCIRAIVAFDLRLEQYRRDLSRLLSGNESGTKRMRTTRASRAALEGGNKAETRKERYFSSTFNVVRVLATGKKEWQDLLVQSGYFTVPVPAEQAREDSEAMSGSASE